MFNDTRRGANMAITILRLPALLARKGIRRSTHYAEIAAGLWPPPVAIGPRARGLPDYECDTILEARIAGKSNDEIRELVRKLVAARKVSA